VTQTVAERAVWLRRDAEKISGTLPPLLAEASQLASTIAMGVHGRRRTGPGEDFWQYRRAIPGDTLAQVDWRRSAKSDRFYIREKEWEAAQTVALWVDPGRSMDYQSRNAPRSKAERGQLLALAISTLLLKAGERVSLIGSEAEPPRSGMLQLSRIAFELASSKEDRPDYAAPPEADMTRGGRAVFFSDFLGDEAAIMRSLSRASDQGVTGHLVQILDETEESFPFDGRTRFQSMAKEVEFETDRARALKDAYLIRLRERQEMLRDTARRTGWRLLIHRTSESPRKALLWLYMALGGQA
jgi:uncharacterized protein (DUF58 family)